MSESASNEVDVVIVGGGLAGLSAALTLSDANAENALTGQPPGPLTFVVLESSPRLGGRTFSPDPALDFGGGYVGISQNYIQSLIRRFQAEGSKVVTIPQYLPQQGVWLFEDSTRKPEVEQFPGDDPLKLPGGKNAMELLGGLDALSLLLRNDLETPWESPLAAAYDGITVQDWIDQQVAAFQASTKANPDEFRIGMSPQTVEAFVASVRSAFSMEPKEISFFYLLYYAASAGSYAAIVDVAGGDGAAEATRFLYGTQSLVDAMAADVGTENIILNAPVAEIDCTNPEAPIVKSAKGVWKAKQVIVAMSPSISSKIKYKPSLETLPGGNDRAALCKAMLKCHGRTIKGFVRFKDSFWRDPGRDPKGRIRQGFLLSTANYDGNDPKRQADFDKYPLDWTLDNVWETKQGNSPDGGAKRCYLMTFIVADSAKHWATKPAKQRARAVIEHLRRVYTFTDADLYDETDIESNYSEYNWPAGGLGSAPAGATIIPAPDAVMGPNTLSKYGWALRVPVGPIHWAGSESATEWVGYMNGAIQSGFRAAGEVLGIVKPLSYP